MDAVMNFLFENQNFQLLEMILGLCLFLFGMNLMGEALERRAGTALRSLLGKLTTNKLAGFLTGMGVTAVIQSGDLKQQPFEIVLLKRNTSGDKK